MCAIFHPPFPENGATGSGTLAMVTFKVVGTGETGLDFKPGFTELYTVIGEAPNPIEYPIDHTAKNGFFRNAGAPISIELIVGIVVVVILVIVALLYFRRKRASTRS